VFVAIIALHATATLGVASDQNVPVFCLDIGDGIPAAPALPPRGNVTAATRRSRLLLFAPLLRRRLAPAALLKHALPNKVGRDRRAGRDALPLLNEHLTAALNLLLKLPEQRVGSGLRLISAAIALIQQLICQRLLIAVVDSKTLGNDGLGPFVRRHERETLRALMGSLDLLDGLAKGRDLPAHLGKLASELGVLFGALPSLFAKLAELTITARCARWRLLAPCTGRDIIILFGVCIIALRFAFRIRGIFDTVVDINLEQLVAIARTITRRRVRRGKTCEGGKQVFLEQVHVGLSGG
jgi:hypothetical protein